MSRIRKRFSADDLREVEAAVKGVETTTSGEIVTYIAGASDEYHLAAWKGAALGAVVAALAAAGLYFVAADWDAWVEAWVAMPALLGGAMGYLIGRLPAIRWLLTDREILDERVRRRAAEVFLSEEVFATRDRTGVLLFLSLLERRVVVLADSGISARVPQAAWDGVVADLVAKVRAGEAARGLVIAVEACGRILTEFRIERREDDADELPDEPRSEVPE